jgi:starch phosphorylase
LHSLSDAEIWEFRTRARTALVGYVRERLAHQLAVQGAAEADVKAATGIFDPNALTLGFARRFATYKRPNLMLHDPERLARLLRNRERPFQLVVAGKAHPNDEAGQALIEQWVTFTHRADVCNHVVFLADYDMLVAERLVQGVDVWINTPRRPWEACGTSGMKVLVNGGLNLSELDGWWAEAYTPAVGWAIGDQQDHGDDPSWDTAEADALYALLEGELASTFYARDDDGIPTAWVARVRESMAQLTPAFSSSRMVRQYLQEYYLPAATAYQHRAAAGARCGAQILAWRESLAKHWAEVRIAGTEVSSRDGEHAFHVRVHLGELSPTDVSVELYADAADGRTPVRQAMSSGERDGNVCRFSAATGDPVSSRRVDSSGSASDRVGRRAKQFTLTVRPYDRECRDQQNHCCNRACQRGGSPEHGGGHNDQRKNGHEREHHGAADSPLLSRRVSQGCPCRKQRRHDRHLDTLAVQRAFHHAFG